MRKLCVVTRLLVSDVQRRTVLHAAACLGDSKIVELLISNGAKISAQSKDLQMPLHFACSVGAKVGILEMAQVSFSSIEVGHNELSSSTFV